MVLEVICLYVINYELLTIPTGQVLVLPPCPFMAFMYHHVFLALQHLFLEVAVKFPKASLYEVAKARLCKNHEEFRFAEASDSNLLVESAFLQPIDRFKLCYDCT